MPSCGREPGAVPRTYGLHTAWKGGGAKFWGSGGLVKTWLIDASGCDMQSRFDSCILVVILRCSLRIVGPGLNLNVSRCFLSSFLFRVSSANGADLLVAESRQRDQLGLTCERVTMRTPGPSPPSVFVTPSLHQNPESTTVIAAVD